MIKFSCVYEKILLPLHRKFTKNPQYYQKTAIKNVKKITIMKDFLAQTAMTALEKREFKLRITDPNREFHFTIDQYHNRHSGRTRATPAERMAMVAVLDEIRNEMQHV